MHRVCIHRDIYSVWRRMSPQRHGEGMGGWGPTKYDTERSGEIYFILSLLLLPSCFFLFFIVIFFPFVLFLVITCFFPLLFFFFSVVREVFPKSCAKGCTDQHYERERALALGLYQSDSPSCTRLK